MLAGVLTQQSATPYAKSLALGIFALLASNDPTDTLGIATPENLKLIASMAKQPPPILSEALKAIAFLSMNTGTDMRIYVIEADSYLNH